MRNCQGTLDENHSLCHPASGMSSAKSTVLLVPSVHASTVQSLTFQDASGSVSLTIFICKISLYFFDKKFV